MTITQCIIILSLVESWYSLRASRISRRSERRRVVYRGPPHGFWGGDAITQVQGRSTHREWHHPLNTHTMYYSPLPECPVHLLVKIRYFTTQNSVSRLFILYFIWISYLQWTFYSKWNLLWTFSTLSFVDEYAPPPHLQPSILFILVNIHLKTIKLLLTQRWYNKVWNTRLDWCECIYMNVLVISKSNNHRV